MGRAIPPLALVQPVLEGRLSAVARMITHAESGEEDCQEALAEIYRHAGRAHVVGITGVPGSGKSALVTRLCKALRAGERSVGVIAIDPSSPFSGGSILGDRIRMNELVTDPGVFIRSMATRGALGGLARASLSGVDILDAAGYDVVLIETVGVGQDEIDVVQAVHTTLVVSAPAASDAIPSPEKRLTVSAYLLEVYCGALSMGHDPLFDFVARLTADFLKDQVSSENTFPTTISDLSQLGAAHYTWNKLTLKRLLTEDEFLLIETLYGIDRRPNYERSYLLERQDSWLSVVDRLFLTPEEATELLESARQKMLEARNDSELAVDDRVDPLTCAAVSKALVIAATTFDERSYFLVARQVMESTYHRLEDMLDVGDSHTPSSVNGRLKTVDVVFVVDALLTILEYEWDRDLWTMVGILWDFLVLDTVDDRFQMYRKPELFTPEKPKDYIAVPDLFPIFDYQSDRLAETTVLMKVARKIACLNQDDDGWDVYFSQVEALEKSIDRNQVEHIEYLQQIEHMDIFHGAIVLRGPFEECQHWKANLSIAQDMDVQIYVIPYESRDDFLPLPSYLPDSVAAQTKDRVTAFLVEQGEEARSFTDLTKLNAYLPKEEN